MSNPQYALILLVSVLCAWSAAAAPEETVPLVNPGMETPGANGLPDAWSNIPDIYQQDTSVAHSGAASLRFINTDPKNYKTCSQSAKLQPGRLYDVGAWIKTEGIEGSDSGATVCLEWYDAQSHYLGGSYPPGIKGTNDWTFVHGNTGNRVPEGATACSVSCYVRQNMTGKAWFDDVVITLVREDPLHSVLVRPNYRNLIPDAGPAQAIVRALVNPVDYDLPLSGFTLGWRILQGDQVLSASGPTDVVEASTDLNIPVEGLAHGEYGIEIALSRKDTGEPLSIKRHNIKRVADLGERLAYIDEYNRIIVNGKPFFPLGMYWGTVDADQLNVYADSAFNCLMPYGPPNADQMALCQQKGLKVIYSVKDVYYGTEVCPQGIDSEEAATAFVTQRVNEFRTHPALLAWYINDEFGPDMIPKLTERQKLMESLDPGHPTWVVLYQVDIVRQYLPTFDVIGTDPYPIPHSPAARAIDYARKTVAGVAGSRPVWQVPQVFNWACYRATEEEKKACRPPTYEEMRSMAWQSIVEGANGLVFYSWFDIRRDPSTPFETHWPLVKQMAKEIADWIPALLSVEPIPKITAVPQDAVSWRAKQLGKATHLFVVNATDEAKTATFQCPESPEKVECGGQAVPFQGNEIPISLKPLEVQLLTITGLSMP